MNQLKLLSLYPWPDNVLKGQKPIEILKKISLDGDPDVIWRWLSDTSRFNRALGMAEREEREVDGRLVVTTSALGKTQEWIEHPWKWIAGKNMVVDREYIQGMAEYNHSIFHFERKPEGGSDLYIYMGFIPNGFWGGLLLKLGLPQILKQIASFVGKMDEDFSKGELSPSFFVKKADGLTPEGEAFLNEKLIQAKSLGLDDSISKKIRQLIEEGDSLDIHKIRIKELVLKWGENLDHLLKNFFIATSCEIFQMSWDTICPSCLGSRSENENLSDLLDTDHCDACQVQFETSHESAVEVTFKINPQIRKVKKLVFCAAEPAKKNHIKCQWTVPPNEISTHDLTLPRGNYNLRTLGGTKNLELGLGEGNLSSLEWDGLESRKSTTSNEINLGLKNPSDEESIFILEEKKGDPYSLHPREVFSNPTFRTLFSNEKLGEGVQLYLGNQTILFTDVVGSTKFYESSGDKEAFRQIRGHFKNVFDFIEEEKGVVVKTIGDAVMAAFATPSHALRASEKMHQYFDSKLSHFHFRLRVSAHTGMVIAVNQNTGVDYFGATVNVAAKLQAIAEDAQLGVSEEFAREIDETELSNWTKSQTTLNISGRGEITAIVYTLKEN